MAVWAIVSLDKMPNPLHQAHCSIKQSHAACKTKVCQPACEPFGLNKVCGLEVSSYKKNTSGLNYFTGRL